MHLAKATRFSVIGRGRMMKYTIEHRLTISVLLDQTSLEKIHRGLFSALQIMVVKGRCLLTWLQGFLVHSSHCGALQSLILVLGSNNNSNTYNIIGLMCLTVICLT